MPTPRTVTETLNRIETTPASNDPHRLRFYLSTPVKVIRFKVALTYIGNGLDSQVWT